MITQNKKLVFFCILVTLLSCASNRFFVIDKSFYSNSKNKSIYIHAVSSIKMDFYAREYFIEKIKKKPRIIQDSLTIMFNQKYKIMAEKYLNKKLASLCAISFHINKFDSINTNKHIIFNKNKSNSMEFIIPDKTSLNLENNNCDYALFITDLSFEKSGYIVPFFCCVPFPSYTIASACQFSENAFYLKGKYILWDYSSGSAVCAGEMIDNVVAVEKWNNNLGNKLFYSFIAKVLDKTKYWQIFNLYEEE